MFHYPVPQNGHNGKIGSNSQKYTVWVKIIHFSFIQDHVP